MADRGFSWRLGTIPAPAGDVPLLRDAYRAMDADERARVFAHKRAVHGR